LYSEILQTLQFTKDYRGSSAAHLWKFEIAAKPHRLGRRCRMRIVVYGGMRENEQFRRMALSRWPISCRIES
jgi:hypothetical protein